MHFKTTITLLALAGICAVLFWKGPDIGRRLGISAAPPPEGATTAVAALEGIKPKDITRVEVRAPDIDSVELNAPAPGQPLALPGNWPARAPEVAELVNTLANLQTRFAPVAAGDDLTPYGLDPAQKPVTVQLEAGAQKHTLLFGQPDAQPGENPFTLPTYLQVDGGSEIIRLGPDVLQSLRRPAEFYRKRQIFPDVARLKVADTPPPRTVTPGETPQVAAALLTLPADSIDRISATGPAGNYALQKTGPLPVPQPPEGAPAADAFVTAAQLADVWRLDYPVRDRVDPAKLKALLRAVPDLWVERFLTPPAVVDEVAGLFPRWLRGRAPEEEQEGFLEEVGLSGADALELEVRSAGGSTRRLLIGKVSRSTTRTEPAPQPMFPGQPPPPPRMVTEEYRYAKLADNPLVFEVKGDKLKDVFFSTGPPDPLAPPQARAVDELRDPNLLRFETDQVTRMDVSRDAHPVLGLKKTKGDPKATSPAARRDRWDVTAPYKGLAETNRVEDLLRPFETMQARKDDIIDRPAFHSIAGALGATADLGALGLDTDHATRVTIATDRTEMSLLVGRHNAGRKKLFVRVEGSDRVNVVDDNAAAQLDKHPCAFRSLKLFDVPEARVESVAVAGRKGEKFELQEQPGLKTTWRLTAPVNAEADNTKAQDLARDLGDLQASEFVYDPPSAEQMAATGAGVGSVANGVAQVLEENVFGLKEQPLGVTVRFGGPEGGKEYQVFIGKQREGKPEYYATSSGAVGTFAINDSLVKTLEKGSLGLLPLQLWQGVASDIKSIEITRGTEEPFTLAQDGSSWRITAPLQASVDAGQIQPLASALASVRAERYEAHSAPDLALYGLQPPSLRVKFRMAEKKPALAGQEPKEEIKERVLLVGKPEPPKVEVKKEEKKGKDDPFAKKDEEMPGRFARLEGDEHPAVLVIPDSLFKEADKSLLDLLNRKLLSVDASAVTKIQSATPAGTVTLVREGNNWKPEGAVFAVDKPTIDALVKLAGNLSATRYADYGSKVDWAKYGLDSNAKPTTFSITVGADTHKVELGKAAGEKQPDGERFARVDGGQGVAVLPAAAAKELSRGKLDFVDRSLLKFDLLDLQTIRRTMGKDELELKQGATGGWEITKPSAQRGDFEGLEDLATKLSTLRAERIAAVDVKDLKLFGLEAPAAILRLELTGGDKASQKVLKVGQPVDAKHPEGERFAQVEGSATVAVLPAALAKRLVADPIKFRDRSLASFVNADKIQIEYQQPTGARKVTFVKGAGGWKMTEPLEADAEDEALRELHDSLARLRAEELVADKPANLQPYGLDQPRARWKLFSGDREVLSLLVGQREKIGEKKKDGFRAFAKLEKGDPVALLDMGLTSKLAAEYRKRSLWEPLDVAQASELRVETADGPGSFMLTRGALGWIDPKNPADRLSTEAVNDVLDALASLKAEQFVADKGADAKLFGLAPARKTVTVSTQSGQKRTLLLGRLDESKRAYGKLDDPARTDVFLLSERDTERINRDRGALSINPPKEEKKDEPGKKEEPKKEEPKKEEPMKAPAREELTVPPRPAERK
jgi:Domain of unknown function (DUF4340)